MRAVGMIVKIQATWRCYRIRTIYSILRENSRSKKYFTLAEFKETLSKKTSNPFERRQKKTVYTFHSGATYEGEWIGGMRDGFGV